MRAPLCTHQLLYASVWGQMKGSGSKGVGLSLNRYQVKPLWWHASHTDVDMLDSVTYCAQSRAQVPHRVNTLQCCFSLLAMSDLTPQDGANHFDSNCQLHFTSKRCTMECHKLRHTIIGMVHVWKVGQRHLNMFKTERLAGWRNKGKLG